MKGTVFVIFAFVATCLALEPSCIENEMNKLWPDYYDSTAFYRCEGFRNPIREKCENELWFSFKHQACVNPSSWEEPPLPMPRTPVQILPMSVPKESLERFARFLFTNQHQNVPSEPPYPPTTSGYPTPPTPVPAHPPTPPPTVPPTASPTYPPKPPTNPPPKF